MLAEQDDQGLIEVTNELHPATVADFTEGLDTDETWRVLGHAPLAVQADIFSYFSNAKQDEMVHGGSPTDVGLARGNGPGQSSRSVKAP